MKINTPILAYVLLFSLALFTSACTNGLGESTKPGFYKTQGTNVLDASGKPVVLRGVGLGGWLMPEGYMLKISAPDGGSPTSIRKQITDLVGTQAAEEFYDLYQKNYVQEADIKALKEWGYDHIRLPFHYKVFYNPETDQFVEQGFSLLDQFIAWCKKYDLMIILDMHATPGAQNHLNISDSDGTARLWTEPIPYQKQTFKIWEEFATRYKEETQIIGYDLVNEPVLPEGYDVALFRKFYVDLIAAVRAIDTNHIIFVEGNWFATDFTGLTPPMDSNMVYAFHKYWNDTSVATIQYLLAIRDTFQVPLWLGETGENSNSWFYEVSRMAESNGIGWNWWTHKKYNTLTAPLSVVTNPDYEAVLSYWRGEGPKPTTEVAINGLMNMAHDLHIDSCVYRPDVIASLFDDNFNVSPIPYTTHTIPGTIAAVQYDLGNQGISYNDADFTNTSGTPGRPNKGGAYRNDGVDIAYTPNSAGGFDYSVGWIEDGEWLEYSIKALKSGEMEFSAHIAAPQNTGRMSLYLDGNRVLAALEVPETGSYSDWQTVTLGNLPIEAGEHKLRLVFDSSGFTINQFTFTSSAN